MTRPRITPVADESSNSSLTQLISFNEFARDTGATARRLPPQRSPATPTEKGPPTREMTPENAAPRETFADSSRLRQRRLRPDQDQPRRHGRDLCVPVRVPSAHHRHRRTRRHHHLCVRQPGPPHQPDRRPRLPHHLHLHQRSAPERHRSAGPHHDVCLRQRPPPADDHQRPGRRHVADLRQQRQPADRHRRARPRSARPPPGPTDAKCAFKLLTSP
jgi:hypothetical protein